MHGKQGFHMRHVHVQNTPQSSSLILGKDRSLRMLQHKVVEFSKAKCMSQAVVHLTLRC